MTVRLAVLVATALIGVADAQVKDHDASWIAPAQARVRANPLTNRSEAAAGGSKLFQQRCATCHGPDGSGTPKAPGLRSSEVQAQTDGELYWKISTGNTHAGMPAFSFLPEAQRWQLALHLRAPQESRRGSEDVRR